MMVVAQQCVAVIAWVLCYLKVKVSARLLMRIDWEFLDFSVAAVGDQLPFYTKEGNFKSTLDLVHSTWECAQLNETPSLCFSTIVCRNR